jgi:hypothetical protein
MLIAERRSTVGAFDVSEKYRRVTGAAKGAFGARFVMRFPALRQLIAYQVEKIIFHYVRSDLVICSRRPASPRPPPAVTRLLLTCCARSPAFHDGGSDAREFSTPKPYAPCRPASSY